MLTCFWLQIKVRNGGWRTLAGFPCFEEATLACNRAVFSEKCAARVVNAEQSVILHTRYYHIRDDPDENWRDEVMEMEDEYQFRWQEVGF